MEQVMSKTTIETNAFYAGKERILVFVSQEEVEWGRVRASVSVLLIGSSGETRL